MSATFTEDHQTPPDTMSRMDKLNELRGYGGVRLTEGLTDEIIAQYLASDDTLGQAIDRALVAHRSLRAENGALMAMDEAEAITAVQDDYVNFYAPETVNPYIALSAAGPWIVTAHGAVLHDSGGYGMLGMGHGPSEVLTAMASPWVMARSLASSSEGRGTSTPSEAASAWSQASPRRALSTAFSSDATRRTSGSRSTVARVAARLGAPGASRRP